MEMRTERDPTADLASRNSLLEASLTAVKALPLDQKVGGSIVSALQASTSKIFAPWNAVVFHMDHQVSSLEDQLGHDFWDKPQNPVSHSYTSQRERHEG